MRSVALERGLLFTASDPAVVETIINHAPLKDTIIRVVDPRTILLSDEAGESKLTHELRALGIYVQ